jgi:hypothetical protein
VALARQKTYPPLSNYNLRINIADYRLNRFHQAFEELCGQLLVSHHYRIVDTHHHA